MPSQPISLIFLVNRLAWQSCLAGSSKTAPRILKFSISMGADYWSELIFMPTWVLAFYAHNNFRLDRVLPIYPRSNTYVWSVILTHCVTLFEQERKVTSSMSSPEKRKKEIVHTKVSFPHRNCCDHWKIFQASVVKVVEIVLRDRP